MKNSKDLSKITLAELNNALQAQEQRRLMRSEDYVEGELQANLQSNQGEKDKRRSFKKNFNLSVTAGEKKKDFPPCKHCNKKGRPPFKCWRRPDVKCGKCNKLGHHERI